MCKSRGVTKPSFSHVIIARPVLSVLRATWAGYVLAEGSHENTGK